MCVCVCQFSYLAGYYQALLVTGVVLLTIFEVVRLHLGYIGNLTEKVADSRLHFPSVEQACHSECVSSPSPSGAL